MPVAVLRLPPELVDVLAEPGGFETLLRDGEGLELGKDLGHDRLVCNLERKRTEGS